MIHLTTGLFDAPDLYKRFYDLGELGVSCIRATLEDNGLDINAFDSVFDFGCGCGRIMRHWGALDGPRLHGSDYNPYLVQWCAENLTFADFTVNGIAPPLDYEDQSFDFVYVLSIFTHFVEALQIPWAAEIARVLRPDGHALISVHGAGHLHEMEGQAERFQAGELVVIRPELAGTNATAAFHPEPYLRNVFAPAAGLELVDLRPDGEKDMGQDAVLFRRV